MAFLTVGSGQQYATLSAAVAASHDGDTVYIQAGTYLNDTATINTKISIVGVGGMAHFVADHPIANGKGLLITNTDVSVDHLEFSGARVTDLNGAGIRYQNGHLTVTNSYFHGNENGILANPKPAGVITIDHSEFGPNIAQSGQTHNVYIGRIDTLQITNSYLHDAMLGHELKSRAHHSLIQNNRIFDNNGTASYSIDLPNSGNAIIENNIIQQGPNSPNGAIIAYAAEIAHQVQWPGSSLLVDGNTIINQRAGFAVGVANHNPGVTAQITHNAFYGLKAAQIASGSNVQSGNTMLSSAPILDTSHPWAKSPWDALVSGGASADILHGSIANDLFVGGKGSDIFVAGKGADTIADFSHAEADRIDVRAITTFHGFADVQAHATQNGADTLIDLGNSDSLTLKFVTVGSLSAADFIFGGSSSPNLTATNFAPSPMNGSFSVNNAGMGAAGAQTADIHLSAGNLFGEAGYDTMTGGAGADRFVFTPADLTSGHAFAEITDFNHGQGDKIDLSSIDAIAGGVHDPLSFIANGGFTGVAGQLHYVVNGSGGVNVEGDLNGDGLADFSIVVDGAVSLVGTDFVL